MVLNIGARGRADCGKRRVGRVGTCTGRTDERGSRIEGIQLDSTIKLICYSLEVFLCENNQNLLSNQCNQGACAFGCRGSLEHTARAIKKLISLSLSCWYVTED